MKNCHTLSKKQLLALLSSSNLIGEKKEKILQVEDAVKTAVTVIGNWQQEHFVAIYLDSANKVLDTRLLFLGTINQSLVHPRETFAPAIELRAVGIVLAHNHPSGGTDPSCEDLDITRRFIEAGKLLGIQIVDHIIITADSNYSFRKNGRI